MDKTVELSVDPALSIDLSKCSHVNGEKIAVRSAPGKGYGWFAKETIEEGEWLWRLTYSNRDRIFTFEEITSPDVVEFVFQYDEDRWEYIPKEDPNHYQNHSCDPNSWYQGAELMVARRRIEAGEEITYDYALSESKSPFPVLECECACGSEFCRKSITCDDWKIPEIRKRYRGHFLPYIERKIDELESKAAMA
eukprot:TRINITY_DN5070_c0_g1_i1.p1 TRINITY_DN5070_c0_g1~~TRINITY_DN5070_c0_g1_i1.p1  ORF type:complete len:194 (+),score=31.73 TRINITY_DN5070_c0_g1_i1:242-823(+)